MGKEAAASGDIRPQRRRRWGFFIAFGIVLILLIGAAVYLLNIKWALQEEIDAVKKRDIAAGVAVAAFEDVRNQRLDFFKKRFFLDIPLKVSYTSANFIGRLGMIVPPDISLTDLRLVPSPQKVTFTLKCFRLRPKRLPLHSAFAVFLRRLESFDNIRITSFPPDEPGSEAAAFTIQGEIELP
jgi:hypothetical protein